MTKKVVKVIFDTNIWISFLIGKRLQTMRTYLADGRISIITTEQLILELRTVTGREKLTKYFPKESVQELIDLLDIIAEKVEINPLHFKSRDPKDNFLLDLIHYSRADYLVTGDNDLLVLNPFKSAKILTAGQFEEVLKKL